MIIDSRMQLATDFALSLSAGSYQETVDCLDMGLVRGLADSNRVGGFVVHFKTALAVGAESCQFNIYAWSSASAVTVSGYLTDSNARCVAGSAAYSDNSALGYQRNPNAGDFVVIPIPPQLIVGQPDQRYMRVVFTALNQAVTGGVVDIFYVHDNAARTPHPDATN